MAKCVIFSGTRICSGSPYRVNSKRKKPFPSLTKAERKMRQPARDAINALPIPPAQQKLATDLLDAVLAANWTATKTANAKDIRESVKLLLVDEVAKLQGEFTLIAY
jgi:hypothetical protein